MANQHRAPAIGACLVLALLLPLSSFAAPAQEQSQTGQQSPQVGAGSPAANTPASNQNRLLPDSPGVLSSQNRLQGQTSSAQQTAQPVQQNATQEPSGTAAARTANPLGVAASEPAGSAIAPAKQRRVRTILISVGAVAAAGAALGAVAALSAGSPSRPPGAH
jgi:hypothetical protein